MAATPLSHSFLPTLTDFSNTELAHEIHAPGRLRVAHATEGKKSIDVAYAPFDHVNCSARVVIIGITPGRQQMENALLECRRQLNGGASKEAALAAAKVFASFSGPMRSNLVAMLDDIGVQHVLGIQTTAKLWGDASELAHFTSALRYPVFVDGKNYSGSPNMIRTPILRDQLSSWLAEEMRQLPNAIYVPLGPKVGEALSWLAPKVGISKDQVLEGLPHPSGASGERIAYFLGRKPAELLSEKTNAARLDAARASLLDKISKLGA